MNEHENYHIDELKSIFSAAPCGVGIFSGQEHNPLFLNDAYFRMVGYTPEEYKRVIANDDTQLFFPEDLPVNEKITRDYADTGKLTGIEYRIVQKNGALRWIKLHITPITADGKNCALCFFEDITVEKENLEQMKLVAESIGSSICVLRIKNGLEQLIYANETFFHLIGIDRECYLKNTPAFDNTFTSKEDREKTHDAIQESIRTGTPQEVVYRFLRPGAEPLWMNRRLFVVRQDEANTFLMVSVTTDITKKKQAEYLFEMEHRRYQLVVDEMKAAVFEWNIQTGHFYCSENYKEYAMSEVPPQVVLANQGPSDVIHPDDMQNMLQFFADTNSGNPHAETTLRIRLTAGGYRWCRLVGLFYKDEQGNPTHTLGMIIDISEEKEKSVILDSLLNELPGGIAVFKVGKTLECQYFNDGFAKLIDHTRNETEVILRSGEFLENNVAAVDIPNLWEEIQTLTASGSQINSTFRFLNRENEQRWIHLNGSKLREEDGCPIYYCVFTAPSEESALYQSIVADSTTGVFVAEKNSRRIVYINRTIRKLYNVDPETPIIGRLIFDIIPPETALLNPREIETLPEDGYMEFHRPYGDRFFGIRAKSLNWNGVDAYILYLSDETEEHQKRIQQQELLNLIPMGIGIYEIVNGETRQTYMNDGFYRMIDESRDDHLKKQQRNFMRSVNPEDFTTIQEAVVRITNGSQEERINHRVECGDGQYRWFQMTASVVKREPNKITLYCCYANIDAAIVAQEELKKTNETLQKLYYQELSQRKIMEKDSAIAIRFNVTQDKLISYKINQGAFKQLESGTVGGVIRPYIDERIPTEEERRKAADFYDKKKAMVRFRNGVKEFSTEYRSRLNDGRLYWIHAICRLEKDVETGDLISYTFFRDIDNERKKELTAESVIDEETDFVMLLNTVSHTAMLLRLRNNYQDIEWKLNEEFPFEKISWSDSFHFVAPEDREAVIAFFNENTLIERLKTNPVITITYRHNINCPGEAERRKKTRAFYLDDTRENIVIARQDITDLYKEEQEQKRVLQTALEEAKSASRAKSDFLSRMSHDLRTPMNVIIGLTSLALDNVNDPREMESTLNNIISSSKYLLNLINDCLDLEKITSGKFDLHPEPYPYHEFYNNIRSVIEPLCRQKDITLVMNENENVENVIIADKIRLNQILYNLLSNAVKFTPDGGKVELLFQEITVKDCFIDFNIIVRDNGIGMSEEFQKHMFEAFTQESNNITPEYQGSGLGLPIVKQLCDLMRATINIKSKLCEGTEFQIHFHFPSDTSASQISEVKKPISLGPLQGRRVLLAEDHPLNAMIAVKLLEKAGVSVTTAENGQAAVEKFEAISNHYFDAVLMDIRMPVMNGLDATKAIRGMDRPDAKTTPIIAMTANAFNTDVEESIQAGMNAHLSKPVDPERLYETLATLIYNTPE